MSRLDHIVARAIRATMMVDTAAMRFDRIRSAVVTRFASDTVLDAYNALTYDAAPVYQAGSEVFRQGLFNWEQEMIAAAFPEPPAKVLVGGAGGGREAFALSAKGYDVAAFDPSPGLARSMIDHAPPGGRVEPLIGRYEDLPRLCRAADSVPVDLAAGPPYQAAVFGWTSYSHIRTRATRVTALRAMAALTAGPVAVSFFLARPRLEHRPGRARRIASALGFQSNGDAFTPFIGFYHYSSASDIQSEVAEAGLEIVHASYDDLDGRWPYLVLRRQGSSPEVADR